MCMSVSGGIEMRELSKMKKTMKFSMILMAVMAVSSTSYAEGTAGRDWMNGNNTSISYEKVGNTDVSGVSYERVASEENTGNISEYAKVSGGYEKSQSGDIKNGYIDLINKYPLEIVNDNLVYNQIELDSLLLNNIRHGFPNGEITVKVENSVKVDDNIKKAFRGMGFDLQVVRYRSQDSTTLCISPDVRYSSTTGQTFSSEEYMRNLRKIESIIVKSNALKIKSKEGKVNAVASYMISNYPYDNKAESYMKRGIKNAAMLQEANGPYSLTENNEAVCEGFVYAFNQAMFLLEIPAGTVEGYSIDSYNSPHMNTLVSYNGMYHELDVTGYTDFYNMKKNGLGRTDAYRRKVLKDMKDRKYMINRNRNVQAPSVNIY